jgi:hypothetical protein
MQGSSGWSSTIDKSANARDILYREASISTLPFSIFSARRRWRAPPFAPRHQHVLARACHAQLRVGQEFQISNGSARPT